MLQIINIYNQWVGVKLATNRGFEIISQLQHSEVNFQFDMQP